MSTSWKWAVLAALAIGCSDPEPPEQCRAYVSGTADLERDLAGLTATHGRWLDHWLSNEPAPPDTEQVFRERCSRVAGRFRELAHDLARAGADSPVRAPADRAAQAAGELSGTCIDLFHDSELGTDRAAHEARLREALDALRAATQEARRACGADSVE